MGCCCSRKEDVVKPSVILSYERGCRLMEDFKEGTMRCKSAFAYKGECTDLMAPDMVRIYSNSCFDLYPQLGDLNGPIGNRSIFLRFINDSTVWNMHVRHYSKCEQNPETARISEETLDLWFVTFLKIYHWNVFDPDSLYKIKSQMFKTIISKREVHLKERAEALEKNSIELDSLPNTPFARFSSGSESDSDENKGESGQALLSD